MPEYIKILKDTPFHQKGTILEYKEFLNSYNIDKNTKIEDLKNILNLVKDNKMLSSSFFKYFEDWFEFITPFSSNNKPINKLLTIYVNCDYSINEELIIEKDTLIIYDKGKEYKIKEELYDSFIDELEKNGYDNYICLEKYSAPYWNGKIIYIK